MNLTFLHQSQGYTGCTDEIAVVMITVSCRGCYHRRSGDHASGTIIVVICGGGPGCFDGLHHNIGGGFYRGSSG